MTELPTFVIGDVHGHYDRLSELLKHAGILGPCEACDGTGDAQPAVTFESGFEVYTDPKLTEVYFTSEPPSLCMWCDGEGWTRTNYDCRVVQLGDLGHFGGATGSPTGDYMCYLKADQWIDTLLWGNHDRALVDPQHHFKGFMHPGGNTKGLMDNLYSNGKLKLATTAHGYLLVHAGVHLGFKSMNQINDNVDHFADRLNALADEKVGFLRGNSINEITSDQAKRWRIMDALSKARGGGSHEGGVLWMDWNEEKHLQGDPFNYICGHTSQKDGEIKQDKFGNWCIDIGGRNNGRLAGLWLDDGEIQEAVLVNLNYKENS